MSKEDKMHLLLALFLMHQHSPRHHPSWQIRSTTVTSPPSTQACPDWVYVDSSGHLVYPACRG